MKLGDKKYVWLTVVMLVMGVLLFVLCLGVTYFLVYENNGFTEVIETEKSFDDIHQVFVEGNFDISVHRSADDRIIIQSPESLVNKTVIHMDNHKLSIYDKRYPMKNVYRKIIIDIYCNKCSYFNIKSKGEVTLINVKLEKMYIKLDSSSRFRASGEITNLDLELKNVGDLDISDCQVQHLYADIYGFGDYQLKILKSGEVNVWGRANVVVISEIEFQKNVYGSGQIDTKSSTSE